MLAVRLITTDASSLVRPIREGVRGRTERDVVVGSILARPVL